MFDVCIIGAGPCGISCAITASKNCCSVALVECGRDYYNRKCRVDDGFECLECDPCNVITGFGGCIHYGDSAKLSFYPSGKELYNKIGDDYYSLLEKAFDFWEVSKQDFIENEIKVASEEYSVKTYPVRVLKSSEIRRFIENKWKEIGARDIEFFNSEMIDFCENDNEIIVSLKNGNSIKCKNIVLATGRKGIEWLKTNATKKNFDIERPLSSIGFRFEMPREFLLPLGKLHPDFKFRIEYKGYKYKTFCFCGGDHGGRLKFANYGDYYLLDGHILTEDDLDSRYANFALLRQIFKQGDNENDIELIRSQIIKNYLKVSNGRPIFQPYLDFKSSLSKEYGENISASFVKEGDVYKLLREELADYCIVTEKVFDIISQYAKCSIEAIISNTRVIGLELEGLWDKIETDDHFKIEGRNIYIGGDCGGESQGIMQASMGGIRIAEGITRDTLLCKNGKNIV